MDVAVTTFASTEPVEREDPPRRRVPGWNVGCLAACVAVLATWALAIVIAARVLA